MPFEDLYAGKVDLIPMNLPADGTDLVQDPLWRHEMEFVVPPGDLAADRGAVSGGARVRTCLCRCARWWTWLSNGNPAAPGG